MQLERAFFQTVTVVLVAVMAVAADPLPSLALLPIAEISSTTADQLLQQGNQQYQSGQVEAAIQLWQQARAGYQQLHNQSGEGAALINIGAAAVRLERYKEAAIALEAFLLLAQALPNRHSEAQAFSNLGIAYQALGNYVKAIKSHQQSVKIMLSLGDRQGVGQSLGNLGNALEALGDYENATLSYQQSLKIARQVGDRPGGSIALNNLGVMYTNLGKYKEALPLFQESLKVSQALGDQAGQASTLINLGSVYQSLGNNNKAISYYQQSLKLAQAVKVRRYELEALGNLGLAYGDLRDYPRALQCQEQSLKLAQAIGDRRSEAMALNNMGHILLSTGRLAEAEAKLRMALKLREQLRDALDDNYKISLIDTQLYTYTLLQKVLIAGRQFEAALEVAEQGRARAFVELLAKRLSQEGNGRAETPETLALSPTLQQIKATARRRNATIVEYTLLTDNAFKFRGKIRGPETDLLIWVVQPQGSIVFRQVNLRALQQQGISLTGLVTATRSCLAPGSDCKDMERFLVPNHVKGPQEPSISDPGLQKLYELLIQPISDLLPNDPNASVIFIPQEALFLVPFPALKASSGKYLIEQHTVLTAPAIQVLDLTYKQRQKQVASRLKSAPENTSIPTRPVSVATLVVGNPTMPKVVFKPGKPPEQLLPLPGAEEEALEVAELLHTKAILGKEATKANVMQQLPGASIVHLATHGLLEYGRRNGSFLRGLEVPGAIALAPSGTDDGLLTATEIMQLKLTAELVVLSACNTGQGHITGDGVVGLSRAWIAAGVPSVIVSLWTVPDDPTATLMTEFYQNLQENPDKAQALRQAMLTTMKEYPRPLDWAAFTLIGEAK